MVGSEPSPQSIETVLVWMPPGLTIVPLTVIVSFSLMLDDESTRPGEANSGAGSLMATTVCAKAVSPWWSVKVTPMRSGRPSRRCSRAGPRRRRTRAGG